MAEIKKIYDDAAMTNQVYPQTHEKAVVDNNGTTAETKFKMINDLVNQKQMEVGAVPSDLTPTPSSTNWVTSGGVYESFNNIDKSLSMEITGYTIVSYSILNTGKFGTTASYEHGILPVNVGEKYIIKRTGSGSVRYAFATSASYTSGGDIPMVSGTSVVELSSNGAENIVEIPSSCTYFIFNAGTSYPVKVWEYREKLNFLEEVKASSANAVTSRGTYKAIQNLESKIFDEHLVSVANGSKQNLANANYVHTDKIYFGNNSYVKLIIDKPLATSTNHYELNYIQYNSDNTETSGGRNDTFNTYTDNKISKVGSAAYIIISIREENSGGSAVALRTYNFDDYPVKYTFDNGIYDEFDARCESIEAVNTRQDEDIEDLQDNMSMIIVDEGGGNVMPTFSASDIIYGRELNNVGTTQSGTNLPILGVGIPVEPNTAYCIADKSTLQIVNINKIVFKRVNDLTTQEANDGSSKYKTNVKKAFTTPSYAQYMFIQRSSSANPTTVFDNLMVQKGSVPKAISIPTLNPSISIPSEVVVPKTIVCWGDSLTYGAGSTTTTNLSTVIDKLNEIFPTLTFPSSGGKYTDFLQVMLPEYTIRNCGVGGETINTIAAREGANPIIVSSSFTLPSDATTVSLGTSLTSVWGNSVAPLDQGTGAYNSVNPCYVQGIPCTLSLSSGVYYIKRMEEGDRNITMPANTIINLGGENRTSDCEVAVLWCYQNGGFSSDGSVLVEKLKKMISCLKTKKYVIVNCHTSNMATYDSALRSAFGNKMLDWRNYVASNALYDFGITPSSQDETDMSNGIAPSSLRIDSTHLNAAGYAIFAYQLYLKGQQLGYW